MGTLYLGICLALLTIDNSRSILLIPDKIYFGRGKLIYQNALLLSNRKMLQAEA